jgi:hypothetical protein
LGARDGGVETNGGAISVYKKTVRVVAVVLVLLFSAQQLRL